MHDYIPNANKVILVMALTDLSKIRLGSFHTRDSYKNISFLYFSQDTLLSLKRRRMRAYIITFLPSQFPPLLYMRRIR